MARKGDWMQTYRGKMYWPLDPLPEEVNIKDIAHALSLMCRYNGHCDRFYSVAEHSVLVSQIVPPEYAFQGLMHDATEAYICDMARPLKNHMAYFREVEQLNWLAIARKFGLPDELHPSVKAADTQILLAERRDLGMISDLDWQITGEVPSIRVVGLAPGAAEETFLDRFKVLYTQHAGL